MVTQHVHMCWGEKDNTDNCDNACTCPLPLSVCVCPSLSWQGRAEQHPVEERAARLSTPAPGGRERVGLAHNRRRGLHLERAAHPFLHLGTSVSAG